MIPRVGYHLLGPGFEKIPYCNIEHLVKKVLQELVINRNRFLDTAVGEIKEVLNSVFQDIKVLNNLECIRTFHGYTLTHSLRASVLSVLGGITLDFTQKQLKELCTGALLHDYGKTYLNKTVLDKPAALTPGEFNHIELHSSLGYELLTDMGLSEGSALVALQHHERYDGSGYPMGLAGEKISRPAMIVAVSDTFEALTARRVYRNAYPVTEAVELISRSAGTKFDPVIVKAFLAAIGGFRRLPRSPVYRTVLTY